jgi:hypothetical protein
MCGVQRAPRPELAAKVKDLTWTGDNLLRQVVYEGHREDRPVSEARREVHTRNAMRRAVGSFACSARSQATAGRSGIGALRPPRQGTSGGEAGRTPSPATALSTGWRSPIPGSDRETRHIQFGHQFGREPERLPAAPRLPERGAIASSSARPWFRQFARALSSAEVEVGARSSYTGKQSPARPPQVTSSQLQSSPQMGTGSV